MTAHVASVFFLAVSMPMTAGTVLAEPAPPAAELPGPQSGATTAAAKLAAKFSGAVTATTPVNIAPPEGFGDDQPETVAPSIITAISQSARAVGDHAADKAADRARANAEKRRARARDAKQKKAAEQNSLEAKGKQAPVGDGAPQRVRAMQPPPTDDEPSLLAKIFNPANWKSSTNTAEKETGRGASSAFKPEE